LNSEAKKIVFDKTSRFMAALNTSGSVEVWALHGERPKYLWDLKFKSVADIQANSVIENQFFILMN